MALVFVMVFKICMACSHFVNKKSSKRLNRFFFLFLVLVPCGLTAQGGWQVKDKKLYIDLAEATRNKKGVYNLSLCNRRLQKHKLSAIAKMKNIQSLSVANANLDALPDEIFTLPDIRTLDLSNNSFKRLPFGICKMHRLERLIADNNQIEAVPEWIGKLSNLRTLLLFRNNIRYVSPQIGRLKKLDHLELSDNRLRALPDEIGDLSSLTDLGFRENRLAQLPNSIVKLSKLEYLELGWNRLTSLPEEIGRLQELKSLSSNGNQIAAIPSSLSDLTKLEELRLSENKIDSIPEKLFLLPALACFTMDKNPLRHIPLQVVNAVSLRWFSIAHTKISYEEYRRIRRRSNRKMEIPHDKPVYFEDDEKPCCTEIEDLSSTKIFTKVEIDATYWGGWQNWQPFLQANIGEEGLLPAADDLRTSRDTVTLRFIIRKNGGISNIEAVQSGNEHTKEEAIRLLKLSCPSWAPAENGGKMVNVWTQQTFVFELTGKGETATVSVRAFNPSPALLKTFGKEE